LVKADHFVPQELDFHLSDPAKPSSATSASTSSRQIDKARFRQACLDGTTVSTT
jgi:hypothetical protein